MSSLCGRNSQERRCLRLSEEHWLPTAHGSHFRNLFDAWSSKMTTKFHHKNLFPFLAMALLLSACSTTNWNYQRTPSTAFAHPETTTVGALFQEVADKHSGLSGFSIVTQGDIAFMARL